MTKKRFVMSVSLMVVAALAVSGCETAGQSAGMGAGLGGALGAVIGHQSGHGWEGAAIGAAVGGLAGYAIHKAKARKVREEAETAQYYQYQPTQGVKVYPPDSAVAPVQVTKGNTVKASMEYAVLGAPPAGITVVEKRVLKKDGNVLTDLDTESVTRTNGTWVSAMDIEVGNEVEPGAYEIVQSLETPEGQFTKTNAFTVY
jgi:hypothetical protein